MQFYFTITIIRSSQGHDGLVPSSNAR